MDFTDDCLKWFDRYLRVEGRENADRDEDLLGFEAGAVQGDGLAESFQDADGAAFSCR